MYYPRYDCACGLAALPENQDTWVFPDGRLSTPLMGGAPKDHFSLLSAQQSLKLPTYHNLPRATAAQTYGVEFPFEILQPYWTSNLYWFTGQGVVNIGTPRFSNDPDEYLRSAMIESDWDRVANWLSWKIATIIKYGGSTANVADSLALFPFGSYKYVGGSSGKKFYPFSMADYQSFFAHFKRYETGAEADKQCLDAAFNTYKMAFVTAIKGFRGNVPMQLSLTPCRAKLGWWHGIINVVGLIAAFVGTAYASSLLAAGGTGTGTAVGGAVTGAGETAGAVGAGAVSTGTAAELGTVAVTASALPTIPTAVGAGSLAAATGAGISMATEPLETVQVTATRATPSALPGIATGIVDIAAGIPLSTSPANVPAPGQTVEQPTQQDQISTPGSESVPTQGQSTLLSKFLDAAKKFVMQYSGAILRQKIEEYLMRKLTPDEERMLNDIESQRRISAGVAPQSTLLQSVLPWLIGGTLIAVVVSEKPKRKRKG